MFHRCLRSLRYPRKRQPSGHLRLGFLADFAWWPNRQNWKWLINEILPKVHRPIAVHVFGRQSEQIPTCDRVVAHGFVHELGAVWDQVDIMICPIRDRCRRKYQACGESVQSNAGSRNQPGPPWPRLPSGSGLVIIDSAEEWVSFLNSSEADRLATQLPSEELSRQFAADRHREKLNNFIMNVALRGNGKISRSYKHASN